MSNPVSVSSSHLSSTSTSCRAKLIICNPSNPISPIYTRINRTRGGGDHICIYLIFGSAIPFFVWLYWHLLLVNNFFVSLLVQRPFCFVFGLIRYFQKYDMLYITFLGAIYIYLSLNIYQFIYILFLHILCYFIIIIVIIYFPWKTTLLSFNRAKSTLIPLYIIAEIVFFWTRGRIYIRNLDPALTMLLTHDLWHTSLAPSSVRPFVQVFITTLLSKILSVPKKMSVLSTSHGSYENVNCMKEF